jgi:NAD(P)-dependent dehydrogenase (short-subunit alcohol dehydrogenase family)
MEESRRHGKNQNPVKQGRLHDRIAMITGAAGGIGRAAAFRFAAEGAKLVLLDISRDVFAVVEDMEQVAGAAVGFQADVTSDDAVRDAVASAIETFGRIDVLFNTVGGSVPEDAPVDVIDLNVWHRTLRLDLDGTFMACRHVLPYMKEKNRGAIVNMSSGAALRGSSRSHAYASAKGAIVSLTRVLAGTYAANNIRVNAICAGRVNTERIRKTYGVPGHAGSVADPMSGEAQYKQYPFWFSQPEDVANVALFLASDESRMITGAAIAADGGRSAY